MAKSYYEKLKHPKWQQKRLEVLERDDWECQVCLNRNITLHVHHKTYQYGKEPWDYPNKNFITLCEDCHGKLHNQKREARITSLNINKDTVDKSNSKFGDPSKRLKPHYEMEIIRLMLTFGKNMIRFVSENIEPTHFIDDNFSHLFKDIVQRSRNGEDVDIKSYTNSKNKYKSVAKDILTDKHLVSGKFSKGGRSEYQKDKNPVLSAKSSMKPMLICFYQSKKDEISDSISEADDDKKKEMVQELKSIQKDIVRLKKTASDDLFDTPDYFESKHSLTTKFNYILKRDQNAED